MNVKRSRATTTEQVFISTRQKIFVFLPFLISQYRPLSNEFESTCDLNMSLTPTNCGYKERRREAHTQAEQKRRDAIKKGYEDLQHLVPTCLQQDSTSSYKLSKATILQRSIEHIIALQENTQKQKNDLRTLNKEVRALQIIESNYAQMLRQHQVTTLQNQEQRQQMNQVSEQCKFEIFQAFCDTLFASFDRYVSFEDFNQLSANLFNWLEEHGKPQMLKDICLEILRKFFRVTPQSGQNY